MLNLNIKENISYEDKIKYTVINYISLFMVLFWLGHSYLFFKKALQNWMWIIFFVSALLFLQIIILINLKRYLIAKILFLVLLPLTLYGGALLNRTNYSSDFDYIFLYMPQITFMALSVFAFFTIKHEKKFCSTFTFIFYLITTVAYPLLLRYFNYIDKKINLFAINSVFVVNITLIYFLIRKTQIILKHYYSEKEKLLEKYKNSQSIIEDKEKELKDKEEEFQKIYLELIKIKNFIENDNKHNVEQVQQLTELINLGQKIHSYLLSPKHVYNNFFNYFVIDRPVSDISGDFFNIQKITDNQFIISFGDCTGHGISSTFITLLTINAIRDIVHELKMLSPVNILEQLNLILQNSFEQTEIKNIEKVDIAIFNLKKYQDFYELEYSGARMPAYIYKVSEGKVTRLKPDVISIGNISHLYKKSDFSELKIRLEPHDVIYLVSDGFVNHIYEGKRYGTKRLIEFLNKISKMPFETQKSFVEIETDKILKLQRQLDDILFVGIKLK